MRSIKFIHVCTEDSATQMVPLINKYTYFSFLISHPILTKQARYTILYLYYPLTRVYSLLFCSKMMNSGVRNRYPFSASQWQELEHQALIFKYMVSGMPIPPDLLYTIRRSFDSSSLTSKLLLQQPPQHHIGWNCFQMDFGRKIDPEPGRCRRTDGKKWRCSKEAYPDSKYCERHMHRGRNRSRKPVEHITPTHTTPTPSITPTNMLHISSNITKDSNTCQLSFTPSSTSRPLSSLPGPALSFSSSSSSQHNTTSTTTNTTTTNFLSHSTKHHNYGDGGIKQEVSEHSFLSTDDTWNLTMGNSPLRHLNHQKSGYSGFQNGYLDQQLNHRQDYYGNDHDHHHRPKKVMHHFFDEWPLKDNDSEDNNKLSINDVSLSRTHLSISMPHSDYSTHDFFVTHNTAEK